MLNFYDSALLTRQLLGLPKNSLAIYDFEIIVYSSSLHINLPDN